MFVVIVHDIDNSDFARTCILLSIIVNITLSRFSAICESVCFVSCPPFLANLVSRGMHIITAE